MNKYKNWKKSEKIICINNYGFSHELTINKVYIVDKSYIEYGVEYVMLIGNETRINIFASRFITLKEYINKKRLDKLEKNKT